MGFFAKANARLCRLGFCAFVLAGFAQPAAATIIVYANPHVGGFVPDTASPDFLAALGGAGREHLSFDVDRFGQRVLSEPYTDGAVRGDAFSQGVILSSPSAPDVSLSDYVLVVRATSAFWEIGGLPGYDGDLELDFAGAGGAVEAFGVGTVAFGPATSISLYDADDELLGVYVGEAGQAFGFVGFVAGDGERIGRARIEANGGFYALQDLTFTPEPDTAALLLLGLVGLNWAARRAAFRARCDPA